MRNFVQFARIMCKQSVFDRDKMRDIYKYSNIGCELSQIHLAQNTKKIQNGLTKAHHDKTFPKSGRQQPPTKIRQTTTTYQNQADNNHLPKSGRQQPPTKIRQTTTTYQNQADNNHLPKSGRQQPPTKIRQTTTTYKIAQSHLNEHI
ncbi:hypothetical protein Tcan_14501 [Toxocara canis]|uniref:Uncharacterized protein n=1 Tax=Toxocara canis TaxID=6265 RepID=A0A0B2V9U2_TOXCA|nr:hypothetical protein Tcan_14501 [Toxocara canis]